MLSMLLRKIAYVVLLLWVVSLIVFVLTLLIPGDPALTILGESATPSSLEAVRQAMGLGDPIPVRYWNWLSAAVFRGDLGTSLFSSYSVQEAIWSRAAVTVSLVVLSLVLSLVIGVGVGSFVGARTGSLLDRGVLLIASMGIAIPNFWLGVLLLTAFGVVLGWLPVGGYVPVTVDPAQWLLHLVLPVITLAVSGIAELARQSRASMADTLQLDFVRTLRAKGVASPVIHYRHALRNAMIPILTVGGLLVSRLFGMSVLVEAVFGLPGIGSLLINAVFARDIPMIQGVVLVGTVIVVVVNLVVDVLYGVLNPKAVAK